ncbi:MAG TPA: methyltransferase [Blastocatellia bacterium]|nr:methyltransferase [Blastocatellia bacterium]
MSTQKPRKQNERGTPAPPPIALLRLTTSCWISQAVYVAAKLGIADLLKYGPKPCNELAEATETDPGSLRRLLRLLASAGVFAETAERQFQLTPVAECLMSEGPNSMRAWATMIGEDWHWRMWGELLYSVRTGKPAFDLVHGMRRSEYFPRNPGSARIFDEAMSGLSASEVGAILATYDFSKYRRIIDVADKNGSLIIPLLKISLEMNAVLFDLPHVIERLKCQIERDGLTERLELVGGSFFQTVPTGGDLYVLKRIIHDFGDEDALAILRNCRKAMSGKARLLIIEMVIPPGNEPSFGKLVDLEMMLIGGVERTEAEYQTLLVEAGFKPVKLIPTNSPVSIIECVLA